MNRPSREYIKTFDPLKYGFKSLIALWRVALAYTGLCLLLLLPVVLPQFMVPIGGLLIIFFRAVLHVGLIETALHWYDTGTSSWEMLVSKSYKVVFKLMAISSAIIAGFISAILLTVLLTSNLDTSALLLSVILAVCATIYIMLRYWFVFYYMIDTKCTFSHALQQTGKALWHINFVRIFLSFFLLIPINIVLPVSDWIYTFAMVYIYRKLFPKQDLEIKNTV